MDAKALNAQMADLTKSLTNPEASSENKEKQQPRFTPQEQALMEEVGMRMNSLQEEDKPDDFYIDGLRTIVHEFLKPSKENRQAFNNAQGYSLMYAIPRVQEVLFKRIDEMTTDDYRIYSTVLTVWEAASEGVRANNVRNVQVRGCLDNIFLMISKCGAKVPVELKLQALRLLESIAKEDSVCKLMCNRFKFYSSDETDIKYTETTRRVKVNLHSLLECEDESEEVRKQCLIVGQHVARCSQLHSQLSDLSNAPMLKPFSDYLLQQMVTASDSVSTYAEFCNVVYSLTVIPRLRLVLASSLKCAEQFEKVLETLSEKPPHQCTESYSAFSRIVCFICLEIPVDRSGELENLLQLAKQLENSPRAARMRRWARAMAGCLELQAAAGMPKLQLAKRVFALIQEAIISKSDDFTEAAEKPVKSMEELFKLMEAHDFRNAPMILFAGGIQHLADSINSSDVRQAFFNKRGYELLSKNLRIQTSMRKYVMDMEDEFYVTVAFWQLAYNASCDHTESSRKLLQSNIGITPGLQLMRVPVEGFDQFLEDHKKFRKQERIDRKKLAEEQKLKDEKDRDYMLMMEVEEEEEEDEFAKFVQYRKPSVTYMMQYQPQQQPQQLQQQLEQMQNQILTLLLSLSKEQKMCQLLNNCKNLLPHSKYLLRFSYACSDEHYNTRIKFMHNLNKCPRFSNRVAYCESEETFEEFDAIIEEVRAAVEIGCEQNCPRLIVLLKWLKEFTENFLIGRNVWHLCERMVEQLEMAHGIFLSLPAESIDKGVGDCFVEVVAVLLKAKGGSSKERALQILKNLAELDQISDKAKSYLPADVAMG